MDDDAPRSLALGGLTPLSTCDWPGKLVATVFCQGCPWNCVYCHNPNLIDPRRPGTVAWDDVLDLLKRRVGLLDALVFSGGEPTRQDLRDAIVQVKNLGFEVGLHTMGAYPRRLAELLPLIDWVGFDVKAAPGQAEEITRTSGATGAMETSLELLVASGVPHQVRTTWGPGVMSRERAEEARAWARSRGVADPVLQDVRTEGTRPPFARAYALALGAGVGVAQAATPVIKRDKTPLVLMDKGGIDSYCEAPADARRSRLPQEHRLGLPSRRSG
ncbi:MAG: anaerobic ribonucleoside-triphosphate reductase activating protein [Bifidobacteriaceae bacterium]|jgi:pyruvate formate lyase activating enzyme|nr:anaerobic ribonucleoside-triphosphate reductase activating protein [Bifidobacteriaceae bacterium]